MNPNDGFKRQLIQFSRELRQNKKTTGPPEVIGVGGIISPQIETRKVDSGKIGGDEEVKVETRVTYPSKGPSQQVLNKSPPNGLSHKEQL